MPTTPQQQQAVVARMAGLSWLEVAQEVGVTDRTLRRWNLEPAFKDELHAARIACRDAATDVLVAAASDLAAVLVEVATDRSAPPSARVSAAREALSRIGVVEVKRHEHRELPTAELEAMLQEAVASMTDEELGI